MNLPTAKQKARELIELGKKVPPEPWTCGALHICQKPEENKYIKLARCMGDKDDSSEEWNNFGDFVVAARSAPEILQALLDGQNKLASALEHVLNFAPAVKRRKDQHEYFIGLIQEVRGTIG